MTDKNELTRVEAFSEAVFAIAAAILVLELKMPTIGDSPSIADV